jgi:hypothetical protein
MNEAAKLLWGRTISRRSLEGAKEFRGPSALLGAAEQLGRCSGALCATGGRSPGTGRDTLAPRRSSVRVVADGFLPRMVRNITGALVESVRAGGRPTWIGEIWR